MSKKTFKGVKKPLRQPSPDEIEAFEDSGAASPADHETQKSVNAENRENRIVVSRNHANTDTQESGNTELSETDNAETQKISNTETRENGIDENRESVNKVVPVTAEPVVRLTIDLPENDHRRFKTACAMTRRKMVQEVRAFIERRTRELESESGFMSE